MPTEVDLLSEHKRLAVEQSDLQRRAQEARDLHERLTREVVRVTQQLEEVEAQISAAMRGPPGGQPAAEPTERSTAPAPTPSTPVPSTSPSRPVVADGGGTRTEDEGDRTAPVAPRVIPPPPEGLSKAMWETLLAVPRDGEVRLDALRHKLGLTEAAINNRLMKAKQAKLVQSCGWGQYKLTEEGRRLTGLRLHVVGGG